MEGTEFPLSSHGYRQPEFAPSQPAWDTSTALCGQCCAQRDHHSLGKAVPVWCLMLAWEEVLRLAWGFGPPWRARPSRAGFALPSNLGGKDTVPGASYHKGSDPTGFTPQPTCLRARDRENGPHQPQPVQISAYLAIHKERS